MNNVTTKPTLAFSLVELLVSIGIIAVLAGLLIPTLTRVREKARIAACSSNLRQISNGLVMYANEHNQILPYYSDISKPATEQQWFYLINVYFTDNANKITGFNPIFVCPSAYWKLPPQKGYGAPRAYSLNQSASAISILTITRPASFILVAEAIQNASWRSSGSGIGNINTTPANIDNDNSSGNGLVRYRHDTGANFLMADGHVEYFKKTESLNNIEWSVLWKP